MPRLSSKPSSEDQEKQISALKSQQDAYVKSLSDWQKGQDIQKLENDAIKALSDAKAKAGEIIQEVQARSDRCKEIEKNALVAKEEAENDLREAKISLINASEDRRKAKEVLSDAITEKALIDSERKMLDKQSEYLNKRLSYLKQVVSGIQDDLSK